MTPAACGGGGGGCNKAGDKISGGSLEVETLIFLVNFLQSKFFYFFTESIT